MQQDIFPTANNIDKHYRSPVETLIKVLIQVECEFCKINLKPLTIPAIAKLNSILLKKFIITLWLNAVILHNQIINETDDCGIS